MADRANSTTTLEIHELSGSTLPGAASPHFEPRLQTTDDRRSAVIRMTKLHGLDTEVIGLAERVEALARREIRLWDRRADLGDAVTRALPPRPTRPAMQARFTSADAVVDGARTVAITEPAGWAAEHHAIEAAHAAALVEHERLEADIGARMGLPLADKLASRASRRLSRWGRRLTAMAPRTYGGLHAKAAVLRATVEDAQLYDRWRQALAIAVGADAIRLIEAEAEERFREAEARDGALFDLIARHGPATAEWDAAEEAAGPIWHAWYDARPAMPAALRRCTADHPWEASGREPIEGSTSVFAVYLPHDIERLRASPPPSTVVEHHSPAPWNADETIVRIERVPDERRVHRKAEILAAWDAWQAEIERLSETTGLNAVNAVIEAAGERCNDIEDAIIHFLPRTFEGLQAKARWIASEPGAGRRAEHLLRDLCRMPPVTLAPPAQRAPTRDELETYRAFLDMEFRFLNWETHKTPDASGGIWLDNPAGRMHGPDEPPPSSRAVTVLTTLGLMPHSSAEDRRIAETRAA